MAPHDHSFPLHELPQHIPATTNNFKDKSRKLPTNFDLVRDCDLYEITQYTCTTVAQQVEHRKKDPTAGPLKRHCYPFQRLFRKCKEGGVNGKEFNIETTAWEGQYKYVPGEKKDVVAKEAEVADKQGFANYGSYFWSGK